MAGFNLTAQINLVGPTNIKQIASRIRKDLGNVNATVKFKLDPSAAKNVASLNSSLKNLNKTLGSTNSLAQTASASLRALGRSAASVNIGNIPKQINQVNQSITRLSQNSKNVSGSVNVATSEIKEFGKQAALAVRRFGAFASVTSVIYGLTNSINQGIKAYIEYDRELVRLQQVTGKTASGLTTLQNEISRLATSLGVSSKELTTVSVTLAQAGLNASETEKALQALARSTLAPSFDDLNSTVEGSIALMQQFGISAAQLESALGSVNSVAAAFAVEAGDIIAAIQRTGGVFATASKGVSEGTDALNEFIAVFTSVRATTRESAETIATGLRTIFTRIQRGDTIDALKEFGVNLTDAQGKFVGAYKAVELLSTGLSKLDPRDLKFSRIVEELGGFRQIGKVIPLIQQFSTAQQALKVAQEGQGSLARDAVTAQLSLANQIAKVREEFLSLFRSIGQSQGFQTIVRGALTLSSALIKVADAAKSLLPALAVITAFKGAKGLTEFASGFIGGLKRGPDNRNKGDARPFADGGRVRYFARGGVVPGSGNRDTVPAMLQPGEFVIRKKAVETIGADRLHKMNKYASGGSVISGSSGQKRQKFAKGGPVSLDSLSKIDGGKSIKKFYTPQIQPADEVFADIERFNITDKDIDTFYSDRSSSFSSDLNTRAKFYGYGKATPQTRGLAFEDFILAYVNSKNKTYQKTSKIFADDRYPVDFVSESDPPIEVRFRNERTEDNTLLAKKLRHNILSNINMPFTTDDDIEQKAIDLDKILLYEVDPSYKKSLGFKSGGKIQTFFDGGWVKRMQKTPKSQLAVDVENLEYWIDKIDKNADATTGWSRTYKGTNTEEVDLKELIARKNAIVEFAQSISAKKAKSALKGAEGYEPEELLDAVKLYQGGSGPLTRAMVNNDLLFVDRDEQYDTEDVVNRLKAASQYSTGRKKLYSGIGRGQFYEILRDVGVDQKDYDKNGISDKAVKQMVGKTIDFPTFVSTSYDKSVAEAFIGSPGGLMDISTAKSQIKGIDIDKAKATKDPGKRREGKELPGLNKIKQSKLLKYDDEKEFILPPNTQFKIKKAVNQQIIGTNDQGEQFTLEDYDYFGIDPDEDGGTLELPFSNRSRRDRVVDLSVQMLREGGVAGSLTGIYDSDKIQGGTKVKKALLEQLKASGKAYEVIHGPAGSGKTTLASQRYGENFVLSPEDLAKYQRFVVLSGAGATKSGEFSEDVQSLMSGASGITALMPGEERLASQRQKRLDEAILGNIQDTRSVSQLQGTLRAPANVSRSLFEKFKGVNYLEEYAVGGEVERLAAKFNLGKASGGWWKGKFRDQDILWDMANRRTAYNADDGSAIDISSLPASLKKTWDYQAQKELAEYREYKSMVRGAAQTPRTRAEEEYGKVVESSVLSATQRMAEKKKQEEIAKLAARGGRFTGDYEPTRARQQSKIDRMTPDERKQYYARKFNGYMAGSTVTDEQPSSYLDRLIQDIAELGGPKEVRRLADIPDGDPRARKALNANAIKANKDTAYAESLIKKAKKASEDEANRKANDIALANKFALVGVYPLGYNKSFGPLDIGGKSTFYSATALGTEYQPEIDAMRQVADEAPSNAMRSIQMKKIFSSKPIAFDFDETLVTTDPSLFLKPDKSGIDVTKFDNLELVREGLQSAQLTQLGEELRQRISDTPDLMDSIRVLTARPQSNSPLIADTLARLGIPIPASKITGVSGAENKFGNLGDDETLIDDRLQTISDVINKGKKGIGYSEISGYDPNRVASKRNAEMIEAYIAEEMLTRIGIDLPADAESNRSIDFPNGLGAAASFWGIDPFVPTDIKRTMDGSAFDRFREEIERFYVENPDRYAEGGKVREKYRQILQSILPPNMLTKDGYLSDKFGLPEPINFTEDSSSYYAGGLPYKVLRSKLDKYKSQLTSKEYDILQRAIDQNLLFEGDDDTISTGNARHRGVLAHETFHDIQGNLYDYYPEIIERLEAATRSRQTDIENWYKDPANKEWSREGEYRLEDFFPDPLTTVPAYRDPYGGIGGTMIKATGDLSGGVLELLGDSLLALGQRETIPVLLSAAAVGNSGATSILSGIFGDAGLNKDFYKTLPKFAKGGSPKDTVPALLTPGEFVINKKAAKQIGYSQLNKLNHADKIQGFNKGGAVGMIQKFAAGGMPDFSKWIGTLNDVMQFAAPAKINPRPKVVGESTVAVEPATLGLIKESVKELNKAGFSMKDLALLINQNRQLTIAEAERAAAADVKRLKNTTASIDQIAKAEEVLAQIRLENVENLGKQKNLTGLFNIRNAANPWLMSGSMQVSDIGASSGESQQAILSQAEAIMATGVDAAEAFVQAASAISGVSQSDFANFGISGGDIQQYIAQSMKDRKLLAQMDKQLLAIKEAELRNSAAFYAASKAEQDKLLAELKAVTNEEISERRKIINDLAAQSGESGVGASGLFDFNNSPILNQLKDRYLAREGEAGVGFGSYKLNTRAFTDASIAMGLLAGQAKNLYNVFAGINESSPDVDKIQAARMGAGLESAGTIMSTGLALSGQALAIPGIGPAVAGIGALATMALAASDAMLDWTGSQAKAAAEMEKALGEKRLKIASDKLSEAFDRLNQDAGNLSNVLGAAAATREYTMEAAAAAVREAKETKETAETRTWEQWARGGAVGQSLSDLESYLRGGKSWIRDNLWGVGTMTTDINRGSMDTLDWKNVARTQAEKFAPAANQGYRELERLVQGGFSLDDIRNPKNKTDEDQSSQLRESITALVLSQDLDAAAAYWRMSNSSDPATRQKAEEDLEAARQRFLENNEKAKGIIKTAELARAMEESNRMGRKLAETFNRLTSSIEQSIGRVQFEANQRAKLTKTIINAARGEMVAPEYNDQRINVLENPQSYSAADFEDALDRAVSMVPEGEARDMLRSGVIIESQLGNDIDNTIRSIVSGEGRPQGNAGLSIEEAATEAKKRSKEQIDALPITDELKEFLKKQAEVVINNAQEKASKVKGDKQLEVFSDEVSQNMKQLATKSRDAAVALLRMRQDALNKFTEAVQESTKALLQEASYRRAAANIRRSGDINLREALFGYGESFEEANANLMSQVSSLTGGLTDPADISARIEDLSDPARVKQEQENYLKGINSDDEKVRNKAAQDFQAYNLELNNARTALDMLANSAELAQKALEELKNLRALQDARLGFADKLLTNTPEEADNLNKAFIRLQRNLSGGLNTGENQRDARKAFNETLFRTGNVREAARAGQTVLATQRKETLQLLNDPGFRAAQELNIRNNLENQNITGQQQNVIVDQQMRYQDVQVRRQMAIESGLINNPLVQQSLRAIEDPKADKSVQNAAERYLQAVGLQAQATEEQARLEAITSTRALTQANFDLKTSIDNLTATIQQTLLNMNGTPDPAMGPAGLVRDISNGVGYVQAKTGGQIRANTTGGVDNIPAKLSDREFVVNAKAAEENLDLLHSINSGRKPIYANKGLLVEDVFANLDLNSDSFLSKDELPKFYPLSLYDKNTDNKIDLQEFNFAKQFAPQELFNQTSKMASYIGLRDNKPILNKNRQGTLNRAWKKAFEPTESHYPLYQIDKLFYSLYKRRTYGGEKQAKSVENDINSQQRTEAAGRKADESAKTMPEAESSASRKKTDETLRMLKEDADWLKKNQQTPKPQEEPEKKKPLGERIKEYNDSLAKTQRRSIQDLSTDPTNKPQSAEDLILYREGLSRGLTIEQIKKEKALLEEAKKSPPINPRTGQPFKTIVNKDGEILENEYNAYKIAVLGNTPDPGEDRTLDQEFRRNLILPTMAPNDRYTPKTSGEQARDSINKSIKQRKDIIDKAREDLNRQINEDYQLYEEEMAKLSPEGREYAKKNAEKLSRGYYYDSKMPPDVAKLQDNIRNKTGTVSDRVPGSRTGEGNFWRFARGATKEDLVTENTRSAIAQAEIGDDISRFNKAADYDAQGMPNMAALTRQDSAQYKRDLEAQTATEKESLRMEGARREQEIKEFQNKALEIRVNPNDSSDIYHPQVIESADGKSLSLIDPRTKEVLETRTVPQDYELDKEAKGEFLIRPGSTFSELNSIRAAQAQDQTLKQAKDIIKSEENKDVRAIRLQGQLNRNAVSGKPNTFENLTPGLRAEYEILAAETNADAKELYEQEAKEAEGRIADIRARNQADLEAARQSGKPVDKALDDQRKYLPRLEESEKLRGQYEERQRKKEASRIPSKEEIQKQKADLESGAAGSPLSPEQKATLDQQQSELNALRRQRDAKTNLLRKLGAPKEAIEESEADKPTELDEEIKLKEEELSKKKKEYADQEMARLDALEAQRNAIDAQNARLQESVRRSEENKKQKDIILAHYEQAIAQAPDDNAKAEAQRRYNEARSDLRTSRLGYNPDRQKKYPSDTQRWNDKQYTDAADYIQANNQNAPTYDWLGRKVPAEPGMTRYQAEQAAEVAESQKRRREPVAGYYKGGMVYANNGQLIDFKPKGQDTIPAMLAEGEYVINAESTAKHLPLLDAINSGKNLNAIKPQYAYKGGLIYRNDGSTRPEEQQVVPPDPAQAQQDAQVQQQMEAPAPTPAPPQDNSWWGSSNPLVSGLGYLGGVAQGVGDAVYGGVNVAAGAIATAAAPVTGAIGYALSDAGPIRDSQGNIKQGVQLQSPSENTQRLRAAGNTEMQSDYAAATGAAAQVGIDAVVAGATSFKELGQAVIGQGPIMTGEQTALQRNDEKNIELAGGRDSVLGAITGISQNVSYAASQGAAAVANAEGVALNVAGGVLKMLPGGARVLGAAGKAGSAISGGIGRAAGAVGDVLGNRSLFPTLNAGMDNVRAVGSGLYDELFAPFGSAMREAGEFIGLDGVSMFNRSAGQSTSRVGSRATQAPTRKYANAEEWAAARRQQKALDADIARSNSRTPYDIYADDYGATFTPTSKPTTGTPDIPSKPTTTQTEILDPMQERARELAAADEVAYQARVQQAAEARTQARAQEQARRKATRQAEMEKAKASGRSSATVSTSRSPDKVTQFTNQTDTSSVAVGKGPTPQLDAARAESMSITGRGKATTGFSMEANPMANLDHTEFVTGRPMTTSTDIAGPKYRKPQGNIVSSQSVTNPKYSSTVIDTGVPSNQRRVKYKDFDSKADVFDLGYYDETINIGQSSTRVRPSSTSPWLTETFDTAGNIPSGRFEMPGMTRFTDVPSSTPLRADRAGVRGLSGKPTGPNSFEMTVKPPRSATRTSTVGRSVTGVSEDVSAGAYRSSVINSTDIGSTNLKRMRTKGQSYTRKAGTPPKSKKLEFREPTQAEINLQNKVDRQLFDQQADRALQAQRSKPTTGAQRGDRFTGSRTITPGSQTPTYNNPVMSKIAAQEAADQRASRALARQRYYAAPETPMIKSQPRKIDDIPLLDKAKRQARTSPATTKYRSQLKAEQEYAAILKRQKQWDSMQAQRKAQSLSQIQSSVRNRTSGTARRSSGGVRDLFKGRRRKPLYRNEGSTKPEENSFMSMVMGPQMLDTPLTNDEIVNAFPATEGQKLAEYEKNGFQVHNLNEPNTGQYALSAVAIGGGAMLAPAIPGALATAGTAINTAIASSPTLTSAVTAGTIGAGAISTSPVANYLAVNPERSSIGGIAAGESAMDMSAAVTAGRATDAFLQRTPFAGFSPVVSPIVGTLAAKASQFGRETLYDFVGVGDNIDNLKASDPDAARIGGTAMMAGKLTQAATSGQLLSTTGKDMFVGGTTSALTSVGEQMAMNAISGDSILNIDPALVAYDAGIGAITSQGIADHNQHAFDRTGQAMRRGAGAALETGGSLFGSTSTQKLGRELAFNPADQARAADNLASQLASGTIVTGSTGSGSTLTGRPADDNWMNSKEVQLRATGAPGNAPYSKDGKTMTMGEIPKDVMPSVVDVNRIKNGEAGGHAGKGGYATAVVTAADARGAAEQTVRYATEAYTARGGVPGAVSWNAGDALSKAPNIFDPKSSAVNEAMAAFPNVDMKEAARLSFNAEGLPTAGGIMNAALGAGSQLSPAQQTARAASVQSVINEKFPVVVHDTSLITGNSLATTKDVRISDPGTFFENRSSTFHNLRDLSNVGPGHAASRATMGAEMRTHNLKTNLAHELAGGTHEDDKHGHGHEVSAQHHSRGGLIYANNGKYVNFEPKGEDTIPAMLTPGEYIINADSTSKHLGLLKAINEDKPLDAIMPMYANTGAYLKDFNLQNLNTKARKVRRSDQNMLSGMAAASIFGGMGGADDFLKEQQAFEQRMADKDMVLPGYKERNLGGIGRAPDRNKDREAYDKWLWGDNYDNYKSGKFDDKIKQTGERATAGGVADMLFGGTGAGFAGGSKATQQGLRTLSKGSAAPPVSMPGSEGILRGSGVQPATMPALRSLGQGSGIQPVPMPTFGGSTQEKRAAPMSTGVPQSAVAMSKPSGFAQNNQLNMGDIANSVFSGLSANGGQPISRSEMGQYSTISKGGGGGNDILGGIVSAVSNVTKSSQAAQSQPNGSGGVLNTDELKSVFDKFVSDGISQLTSAVTTFGESIGTFTESSAAMTQNLSKSSVQLGNASQQLASVSIPETINFQGKVQSEHRINGAEAANKVLDTLGPTMEQQTNQIVGNAFNNINRGVGRMDNGLFGPDTNQIIGKKVV